MPLHRCRANKRKNRFFHPDYTVGTGFAPVLPFGSRTRGCSPITAGGESHPAPKNDSVVVNYYTSVRFILQAFLHSKTVWIQIGSYSQNHTKLNRFLYT